MIYYNHERQRAVKPIFRGINMKKVEKKVKGNWIIELEAQKSILGTVTYVIYVFDRTLRQFSLIKRFASLQEAKNYFNLVKNA